MISTDLFYICRISCVTLVFAQMSPKKEWRILRKRLFYGIYVIMYEPNGCANTVLVTRCGFGSSHARVRSSSCTTRPAGSDMCPLSLLACSSLRNPRYCHCEAVFCNCRCDYFPNFISCIGVPLSESHSARKRIKQPI